MGRGCPWLVRVLVLFGLVRVWGWFAAGWRLRLRGWCGIVLATCFWLASALLPVSLRFADGSPLVRCVFLAGSRLARRRFAATSRLGSLLADGFWLGMWQVCWVRSAFRARLCVAQSFPANRCCSFWQVRCGFVAGSLFVCSGGLFVSGWHLRWLRGSPISLPVPMALAKLATAYLPVASRCVAGLMLAGCEFLDCSGLVPLWFAAG